MKNSKISEQNEIVHRTRRWHYTVFKDFVQNTKLKHATRFLFILLDSFTSKNSPQPYPRIEYLCTLMGVGKNKLWRCMKELQDNGFLERKQRYIEGKFSSNLYTLTDEPFFAEDGADFASPCFGETQKGETQNGETQNRDTKSTPSKTRAVPKGKSTTTSAPPLRGVASSPPLPRGKRASRGGSGGGGKSANADGEELFELDADGKALKQFWDEHYAVVYRHKYNHSDDDLVALQYLAWDDKLLSTMGLILVAWQFTPKANGEYDPQFYASHFSRRPFDLWYYQESEGQRRVELIRAKLGWMGDKKQIESGFKWYAGIKSNRLKEKGAVVTGDEVNAG